MTFFGIQLCKMYCFSCRYFEGGKFRGFLKQQGLDFLANVDESVTKENLHPLAVYTDGDVEVLKANDQEKRQQRKQAGTSE